MGTSAIVSRIKETDHSIKKKKKTVVVPILQTKQDPESHSQSYRAVSARVYLCAYFPSATEGLYSLSYVFIQMSIYAIRLETSRNR